MYVVRWWRWWGGSYVLVVPADMPWKRWRKLVYRANLEALRRAGDDLVERGKPRVWPRENCWYSLAVQYSQIYP